MFDNNGLQVGIVSFGYGGCASSTYQDVYVNVATFSDWITSYVEGDNCKPATTSDSSGGGSGSGSGGTTTGDSDSDNTDTDNTDTGTANPDTNTTDTDTGTDTTTDSGTDQEGGTDVDAFLDCFNIVVDLMQTFLANGKGAAGGTDANKGDVEQNEDGDAVVVGGKGEARDTAAAAQAARTTSGSNVPEMHANIVEAFDSVKGSPARKFAYAFLEGVQAVMYATTPTP